MNEIQVFENSQFGQIRTILKDWEPWFVAVDVCKALEINNHKDAITRLDDDEKLGVALTDPHGREQVTNVISEPGLYSLVLGSRKKEAKAFKRWITHEVIPAIRKHGGYLTPEKLEEVLLSPDTLIRLATDLKEERERRLALEGENAALAQGVLQWDSRSFINAAVRAFSYSLRCKPADRFRFAWNTYKKELLYRHGININMRITLYHNTTGKLTPPKTLSMLTEDELPVAVSTITAMCRENEVDISDLLRNIA